MVEEPWSRYDQAYKRIYYAILPPNRAVKFAVDLSTERSGKSLVGEGLIPAGKTFLYLTVLRKGNGIWSLKQVFDDGSIVAYGSDELQDGYIMERRFIDILFTNTSQTGVVNPTFLIEWKE
ncbi:MAG: hypothetical protein ACPL4I_12315 [Bacteroidota bacterium]